MPEETTTPVYTAKIVREKGGALTAHFKSPAIWTVAKALAGGETADEMWDAAHAISDVLEALELTSSDDLFRYANGRITHISLVPLLSIKLSDGFTIDINKPYSTTALDSYARAIQTVVERLISSLTPVEITVNVRLKKPVTP